MKNERTSANRGSKSAASPQSKTAQTSTRLQPEAEWEDASKLKYAILTIPMAEPGKLPAKADEAVVELASTLG